MSIHSTHRAIGRTTALTLALLASLVVGACGGGAVASTSGRTSLSVGLGYIPSVQFAPFYLADQRGDYAAAGLDVTIQNQIDPDLISLVGTGSVDLALADGTSVIPAVSQGIPIRYIATIYGTLPNVVIARAEAGIAKPADLRGKRVGTPGRYGSGYLTLLGILADAGLNEGDLSIELFPDFGQTQALISGAVDAVTGYANNDLVQAKAAGVKVVAFYASASAPFAGPGLIAAESTITAKGDALRAFVAVTLKAMEEIEADPSIGVDAAGAVVPELIADDAARAKSLAVMEATVAIWRGAAQRDRGLGAIDSNGWITSINFLRSVPGQVVATGLAIDDLLDETLLPKR